MGTRGKIYIHNDGEEDSILGVVWSRFDSNPQFLGAEVIADFCASKPLRSMMTIGGEKCFLGMGDFALQFCSLLVSYRYPKIGGEMGNLPNMRKDKRWTSPTTSNYFLIDVEDARESYAPYEYHIYPDLENESFLIEITCNYEQDEDEENVEGIYSPEEVIAKFAIR
jgi:hypothetical protein